MAGWCCTDHHLQFLVQALIVLSFWITGTIFVYVSSLTSTLSTKYFIVGCVLQVVSNVLAFWFLKRQIKIQLNDNSRLVTALEVIDPDEKQSLIKDTSSSSSSSSTNSNNPFDQDVSTAVKTTHLNVVYYVRYVLPAYFLGIFLAFTIVLDIFSLNSYDSNVLGLCYAGILVILASLWLVKNCGANWRIIRLIRKDAFKAHV